MQQIDETTGGTDWRSLGLLFAGNVLFAAGLIAHAFLFNFYLRELQLSATVMGHQVAAMTLGGLTGLLPAGIVIDRVGTRPTLLFGVAITTVGLVLTALAREPLPIYASAFVTGLGAATCRVAWGPLIMRLTDQRSRARAFTWNVALLIGTSAAWTLASGGLTEWLQRSERPGGLSATQIVLLASAALTAGAMLCYAGLRVSGAAPRTADAVFIAPPREVRSLIPLVALWMLAAALVLPFFNVFFSDRFQLSVGRIGAVFAFAQVGTALVLIGSAELGRVWGAQRLLVVWMVVLAPTLLWLAVTNVLAIGIALYFVQGLVGPATNPLIDQVLLERVTRDRHGVVAGWRNAAAEASGAAGAASGGRLLDATSFGALFALAAALAAVSATVLASAIRGRPARATSVGDTEAA